MAFDICKMILTLASRFRLQRLDPHHSGSLPKPPPLSLRARSSFPSAAKEDFGFSKGGGSPDVKKRARGCLGFSWE